MTIFIGLFYGDYRHFGTVVQQISGLIHIDTHKTTGSEMPKTYCIICACPTLAHKAARRDYDKTQKSRSDFEHF
jgi:hypothetical protein